MNPLGIIGRGIGRGLLTLGRNFDRNISGGLEGLLGDNFTPEMRRRMRANAIMAIGASLAGQQPLSEGLARGQQSILQEAIASQQLDRQRASEEAMRRLTAELAHLAEDPTGARTEAGRLTARADVYARIGSQMLSIPGKERSGEILLDQADKLRQRAEALTPKPVGEPKAVVINGQQRHVQMFSDGSARVVKVGDQEVEPIKKREAIDLGGRVAFVDPTSPETPQDLEKTISPDAAANVEVRKQELEAEQERFERTLPYTAMTAQARALEAQSQARDASLKQMEAVTSREHVLREEFRNITHPFHQLAEAYTRLDATDKTGAGDIALIYGFMKMLDPGSTILASETQLVQTISSLREWAQKQLDSVMAGRKLTENARNLILSQAKKIYGASLKNYDKIKKQYSGIAKSYGLDPDRVLIDYTSEAAAPKENKENAPSFEELLDRARRLRGAQNAR